MKRQKELERSKSSAIVPVNNKLAKQSLKKTEKDIDKYLATDAGGENFERLINDPTFLGVP